MKTVPAHQRVIAWVGRILWAKHVPDKTEHDEHVLGLMLHLSCGSTIDA